MTRVAAVVAVAVLLAGCSASGLAFRDDERVRIVEPAGRAETTLPVTIRWSTEDLESDDGGPFFAVFVDRAPIAPGQSLSVLADETCEDTPGCPDLAYFRDRHVYVTDDQEVTVEALPARSGQRTAADDRHEATIVLIDADGRRRGEAAYTVEFTVGSS